MQPLNLDFTIGNVLGAAFKVFFRNLPSILVMAALVFAPLVVYTVIAIGGLDDVGSKAELLIAATKAKLIFFAISSLCSQTLAAAIIFGVVKELHGEHVSIGRSIGHGLARLIPVLLVGLLWGLVVGVGMLLLIVPGFIWMCTFYVAVPVAVIERPGIIASLRRSAELTKDNRLNVFGIIFLVSSVQGMAAMIVQFALVGLQADTISEVKTVMIMNLISQLALGAFGAVLVAVTYASLRYTREGTSAAELAQVFD